MHRQTSQRNDIIIIQADINELIFRFIYVHFAWLGGDQLHILKKIRSDIQQERDIFCNNRSEIEAENREILSIIAIIGSVTFFLMLFESVRLEDYHYMRLPYLLLFAVCVALLIISMRKTTILPSVLVLYIGYVVLFCYCIYASRFIASSYVSLMVLAFIFEMPLGGIS